MGPGSVDPRAPSWPSASQARASVTWLPRPTGLEAGLRDVCGVDKGMAVGFASGELGGALGPRDPNWKVPPQETPWPSKPPPARVSHLVHRRDAPPGPGPRGRSSRLTRGRRVDVSGRVRVLRPSSNYNFGNDRTVPETAVGTDGTCSRGRAVLQLPVALDAETRACVTWGLSSPTSLSPGPFLTFQVLLEAQC